MRRIQRQMAESGHSQEQEEAGAGGSDRFSSNYMATLFPYFDHWSRVYGSIYLYSTGSIQSLFVTDPDMVKELANCKSSDLGKPSYLQKELGPLLGMGILTSNGDLGAHERKVIAPQLFMDKVKGMVDLMVESANEMLVSWEKEVDRGCGIAEVLVDESLRNFSADVTSRAAFGSSFSEGKEIFSKIRQLQLEIAKQHMFLGVPGTRYLPTKHNREIRRLGTSIRNLILDIARRHHEETDLMTSSANNALLRSIVEGAKAAGSFSCSCYPYTPDDFIVDNCKNIYFAGQETTSTTAAWCLMLLAAHPKWQSRARAEVMEVCHQGRNMALDKEMLTRLKTVTMVIQETLRLYPPAPFVTRETLHDMCLGGLHVPRGTGIRLPVALMHRDPAAWGPHPDNFNPGRITRGVAGACTQPHMYMPFGAGTRICAGQNLAVVELKVLLVLLLPRFELTLSPGYVHRLAFRLTVHPGNGVALLLKKLSLLQHS